MAPVVNVDFWYNLKVERFKVEMFKVEWFKVDMVRVKKFVVEMFGKPVDVLFLMFCRIGIGVAECDTECLCDGISSTRVFGERHRADITLQSSC